MKTFLAVYTGSAESMQKSGWAALSEEQRLAKQQQGIAAWHKWAEVNAGAVTDMGGPLGTTKSVSRNGLQDIKNNLAGYTLVRAESHEAAARLFENHPHFSIFPGDAVEIMEVLPVPPAS